MSEPGAAVTKVPGRGADHHDQRRRVDAGGHGDRVRGCDEGDQLHEQFVLDPGVVEPGGEGFSTGRVLEPELAVDQDGGEGHASYAVVGVVRPSRVDQALELI